MRKLRISGRALSMLAHGRWRLPAHADIVHILWNAQKHLFVGDPRGWPNRDVNKPPSSGVLHGIELRMHSRITCFSMYEVLLQSSKSKSWRRLIFERFRARDEQSYGGNIDLRKALQPCGSHGRRLVRLDARNISTQVPEHPSDWQLVCVLERSETANVL
jgi:hypothetical protein